MQYVTSVLNEWGQFLTTVVVASESEGCYARMARGLVARFRRANAPAPKVVYADNNLQLKKSSRVRKRRRRSRLSRETTRLRTRVSACLLIQRRTR